MTSTALHEPAELLSEETKDMHRAIVSLMEELEAVDWYQQRADATTDESLAEVLAHNMREEIEHAMMTLEWIRRRNKAFDAHMRTYLFTEGKITEIEASAKVEAGGSRAEHQAAPRKGASLGLGSLRPTKAG